MFAKSKRHLDQVQESYWQHLGFALRMAMVLQISAVVAVLHALFPAIFQTRVSDTICALADHMRARRNKDRNKERSRAS